jgi:hypothetical protein
LFEVLVDFDARLAIRRLSEVDRLLEEHRVLAEELEIQLATSLMEGEVLGTKRATAHCKVRVGKRREWSEWSEKG